MTLAVVRALGLVTIQDLGRPGRMHEALAPGGALVPELLIAANRAAGNPDGAPAIEVLGRLVVRAEAAIAIAHTAAVAAAPAGLGLLAGVLEDEPPLATPRALAAGDELEIDSAPRRVAYLAVAGGVDAPLILGGRATQRSAGIGAALRAGDRLASLPASAAGVRLALPDVDRSGPIAIIPGPDLDAFAPDALARLCAAPYRISPASDRVGTRLDGAAIPRARPDAASRPMVRGAIEVPPDGAPIVLGPEHPTTGGYPVIAVVAHVDLGRLFAVPPGHAVVFRPVADRT